MSYTPTTWTTGDTITATALNKIENGIADAGSGYDLVIKADQFPPSSLTNFTILSGNSTAVYNKLANGDPLVRAILVFDETNLTFPTTEIFMSCKIWCLSTEGDIEASFFGINGNNLHTVYLFVNSDGTVVLD